MYQVNTLWRPKDRPHDVRARSARTIIVSAAALLAVALAGPRLVGADGSAGAPEVAFERYTLDNGLEVILHQDNRVPLVAVDVWYHVGSGDEVVGRSGFAHLFEHMLFQGSQHVGEDKHFEILKNVGATFVNGSTNTDRTNYFETVPSHQLETALWMESDRMGYLLPLLNKTSLDNQIEVVRNERRQRIDNVPYGSTWMALAETMYPEGHPYKYSVIGRHEDLAAGTLEDVRNFYKKWYAPGNATLVLAGDFDIAEAKKLVQKWFGTFPVSTRPSHRPVPMPTIDRTRKEIPDNFAKLRRVTYAWHTPAFFVDGDAELDLLAHTLGDNGTGRLYKILVHEKQLAQRVSVYQDSQQLSSMLVVEVTVRSDADLAEVERIVTEEVEKVRQTEISQQEFDRAVISIESRFVWRLESLIARAELLQRYNHYVGTPDYIAQDIRRYAGTTPKKIRDAAKKYLSSSRRVELITVPAAEGKK
jgi:zinc protease